MIISMPRGDIQTIVFTIIDSSTGDAPNIELTDIFFTVKKSWSDKPFLFQKRMSTGEIENVEGSTYQFVIEAEDTDNLSFGKYVCDIEIVGDGIKQTEIGDFILTQEATHAINEH